MACVDDGALTPVGKQLLQLITEPRTDEEVREVTGQRLFRVRISLRELMLAGFAEMEAGRYTITAAGRAKLDEVSE